MEVVDKVEVVMAREVRLEEEASAEVDAQVAQAEQTEQTGGATGSDYQK